MCRREDVAGVVNELVQEGKVRYFRLSEAKLLPIVKTEKGA
jgi:aryl-alcohol dehydrogenase-like predicted oxidoreductase